MKQKYIIEMELNDKNRNFGEIVESIINWLGFRDGIKKVKVFSEINQELII